MSDRKNIDKTLLLDMLDQAYDKKSWHGANLRGSLRGLSIEQLVWKPTKSRHNAWELALHCAYWKYTVLRSLLNLPKGSFPRKPSNFPAIPSEISKITWQADLVVLKQHHQVLRKAVADISPGKLKEKPRDSEHTYFDLITGVAKHDIYHAGQIQLLKRLYSDKQD